MSGVRMMHFIWKIDENSLKSATTMALIDHFGLQCIMQILNEFSSHFSVCCKEKTYMQSL